MNRVRQAVRVGLVGLVLCGSSIHADEIKLRSGRTLHGYLVRGDRESRINTFGSTVPAMTLGVVPVRTLDIESVEPTPLRDTLFAMLDELAPTDTANRLALLTRASDGKVRDVAERIAWELRELGHDPKHPLIRKHARGDGAPVPAMRFRQSGNVKLAASAVREPTLFRRLFWIRSNGLLPPFDVSLVERAAAAFWRPRGIQKDVPTAWSDEFAGGKYTLYVPDDLDPLEARPLLVALHGGGIHTVKGKTIRGSGTEIMPVFEDFARRMGWFVVCPTAFEAPWSAARNGPWVEAVVDEITTRWNIDGARVHLFGFSGGAEGAWAIGARARVPWASVGIAAGPEPKSAATITSKRIGLWVFHGEDDEVFPVEDVRKVALKLNKPAADFVYCELPKEKHGVPPAALRDWERYVTPKRDAKRKSAWSAPSFEEPLSKEARKRFGDPMATTFDSEDTMMQALARGGFDAEAAAIQLAKLPSEATRTTAIAKILRDESKPSAARRAAAFALGGIGGEAVIAPLGDTLRRSKDLGLMAACAHAAGQVGSSDFTEDLRWAVVELGKRARSLPGRRIVYGSLDQLVRTTLPVVEAIGRIRAPDDILPELEEALVIGILQDKRPIAHNPGRGEDPRALRYLLAETLARTYKACKAERTLYDMLLLRYPKKSAERGRLMRAAGEGWPKRK